MSNQRYSPEFKDEAVRQIVDRGYSVAEVLERLGVQVAVQVLHGGPGPREGTDTGFELTFRSIAPGGRLAGRPPGFADP